jgi:hypothetical protein
MALTCVTGVSAQAPPPPAPQPETRVQQMGAKTGEIVSQPARDVGMSKKEIPPILIQAKKDPYGLSGVKTCAQLAVVIHELNKVLGPDFVAGDETKENRAAKLAEAGGQTVINSIIPFRGLVREVSGAAPEQRRLNEAIDAGFARRGYLRGVHHTRGCRTTF